MSTNPSTAGTVLVLPGGRPDSWESSRAYQLANIRMNSISRHLRRALGTSFDVRQVRYRFRGWNAPELPAVADALEAAKKATGPLYVVGHSMGGRVAAHLSARVDVAGIVALAPWWPEHDGELIIAPRLVTIHGTEDRWTSPIEAWTQTRRAADRGIAAKFVAVDDAGHFMLSQPRKWHGLISESVVDMVGHRPSSTI